jgi:hypothetical protein
MFKNKFNVEGKVEKYKCCILATWYSKVEGIDIHEIFSFVAKLTSIIFSFFITVSFDLEVE